MVPNDLINVGTTEFVLHGQYLLPEASIPHAVHSCMCCIIVLLSSFFHVISHKLSILSFNSLGVYQENPPLCPVDFTEDKHLYWDSCSTTADNQGNTTVSVKEEPVMEKRKRSCNLVRACCGSRQCSPLCCLL